MKHLLFLILGINMFIMGCGSSSDTSSNKKMRIACIGDSITEGFQLKDMSTQSYPAQLATLVGDGEVENFGIRGRSVIKAGAQPYWDSSEYQKSLSFNPDIVVIMLGTNDMKNVNIDKKDNIIPDYNALIASYKSLSSKPTIYVCLPPPSYGSIQGITNQRIIDVLLPKIRAVAKQNDLSIIDVHTPLSNKRNLFPDTLHPNVEGAKQMAELVYQAIY
jgi:lysophospholipase L1-like esterase